ncbi:calcium-translocating P-type ATPase, PMCA-type [Candidatus Methylomicrobium oryzae]|uniref:calcium-translocating P-type ATPase, PMCA-type n=1 Tax=Candidatus Methylomicrobium oryzae TaxID=2802053 RepID=UPI001923B85D|nr:calcium-translocating P-type ATPase, PMCA-type [Methylomicrobium sp. RS1]MBL1262217.1 calcium-translocating P-type ATPase, PMCA-type [Methylomicrobium sp. RS1]
MRPDLALILLLITFLVTGILLCLQLTASLYRRPTQFSPLAETAEPEVGWHCLSPGQALEKLGVMPGPGLSREEAARRIEKLGPNRLAEAPARPVWIKFLAQFKSLLIIVLFIAALLAAAIGDVLDGIVILIVVLINAVLGFSQEFQAEKSLAALKKMLALQAKIRREGYSFEIPSTEIVPGDIVILHAGDKIPADGRLISANLLEIDESPLTGESAPVAKQVEALPQAELPVAERSNQLFMNTTVTRGHAEMVVTATGMATEIGRLADLLAEQQDGETPLQSQLNSLGKSLALIAVTIILVLFGSALLRGEPLIQTVFTAIALAVASIPEGLPTVVTVTLALGLRRMARNHAIVKRLAAVETLGCTTVICSDKTGTLTVNQMTVRSLFFKDQLFRVTGNGYAIEGGIFPLSGAALPVNMARLLLPVALCNNSHLRERRVIGDPMEGALLVLAAKGGIDQLQALHQQPRIAEIPFDAHHKFMATFHRLDDEIHLYVKGAPEVLLDRCRDAVDGNGDTVPLERHRAMRQNDGMAEAGLRVLGVASRTLPAAEFAANRDLFGYLNELTFIGLVGLMDPPRAEARAAIGQCRKAGIQVKMITGDQKVTAGAIARELGLEGQVLEGRELAAMDERRLAEHIAGIGVFARTAPEQKVRIIQALKAQGHIVAMTGDGVNDAPALKIADIGIAMGVTGTHVAQEAATMILTDDNFATIVKAVKEGRHIYENMVKFIRFQLSTNIGAILTVTGAQLFGLPSPFSAVQLLWINIIMDGPPAMSLSVDPGRPDTMSEAPRLAEARILSLRRFGNLFTYGLTMAAGTLGVLFYAQPGSDAEHAKALAFTTFVLFQVFNVFNARSEKGTAFQGHFFANKMLWLSLFGVCLLQVLSIHWPPAQRVFHTSPLSAGDWLIAAAVASSVLIFEELRKLLTIALRV